MSDYQDFLNRKRPATVAVGFDLPPASLHPRLFPHQRDIVLWALRLGKAAIFADTGLGKTAMQLEYARHVVAHTGGKVLILAPLAVALQTVAEAKLLDLDVRYCRHQDQVQDGVTIANYEMLPHFKPGDFAGVVLDESSILKAHDGKTRTSIIESFADTSYKLACTATPAPNDFMELGNHSQFLGVLSQHEMLAMYFVHDGGSTQDWRLKGHAEKDFWRWVASWACVIRKPSDLGYDDGAYTLPPLAIHEQRVDSPDMAESQGALFTLPAMTLQEQRQARRSSLDARVAACAEKVNATSDQWLIWCELNAEGDALAAAIPGSVQVAGSDTPEHKERAMLDFAAGKIRVLVSKPSICGFGMNWQNCANVAFVGIGHSFEMFYQAIRRCWRFGQTRPVNVHIVISEAESAVLANVLRKEQDARRMGDQMVAHMNEFVRENVLTSGRVDVPYSHTIESGDGWTMHRGDCVDVIKSIATDSVHYSVFSPPFASLYTYSDSARDMGNCATHDEFYRHFMYLVPELLRVTKPGRLLSFHCMNLPTSKTRDGYIGISDFRGILIKAFQDAGWIFHSEVVIWKDPVTAMQRTKALGLLHKQLKKDSCMSRQGIPDYLVTMRKPGDNPERVTHTDDSFPVSVWQRYASPVWMDVNPTRTLQHESAREDADERHICPLQLDVIERALDLWTNPGDMVLSPFAGIGSEGHVALLRDRRFVGIELKGSYFQQACANLTEASRRKNQATLFDSAVSA
ncbi:MAG: hypothetical protein JWO59_3601 [Chloroflexi bacterium]|nr:hypothetical protein [Chloroflexota bacterium]